MVIFNSYVKLPEGTSTVEWVNVSQLPSGPTLQMFPLMWCWWKQSDISLHAFHVYFHSSRWDKTLLRVSFAKPGSPEQLLRLLSDGLPGYIIQSPLLDADKSLSYLVGGLEPWNFMTFHSVGNNHHPNWLSYFSKGLKPPKKEDWFLGKEAPDAEKKSRRPEPDLTCFVHSWGLVTRGKWKVSERF